jgi:adenosylhomocysteine nucleosidase
MVILALSGGAVRGAEPVDLLIVAASDAALRPVLERLSGTRTEKHAAWTFWLGELSGKKVAVTRSEGDPLNAVAATTLAIRLHPPRLIIVCGASRAHDPELRTGDIVVSEKFSAFDGMVSPITALGGGSQPLQWKKLPHMLMTTGERETPAEFFPADSTATALALKLPSSRGRVVAGVLGSAHQVNREADRIAWLRAQWQTSTEDNESAHVAGCGVLLGVPVVGFRVVNSEAADAAEFAVRFVERWRR